MIEYVRVSLDLKEFFVKNGLLNNPSHCVWLLFFSFLFVVTCYKLMTERFYYGVNKKSYKRYTSRVITIRFEGK